MTRPIATLLLILLAASPWTPLCVLAAEPEVPATRDIYEVIERGRLALLADKFQEAADAIEEALTMPEFLTLERSAQFRVFLLAAFADRGREDYLGAHEYIDVVRKSGLNRPVEDRGRVERYLKHSNLFVTAREDGRLVGFARSLTDFCFCCYLSDLAVDRALQGKGIGKRLIEETRKAAGGALTTTLLLSAPTAVTFYRGIKMPQADNCYLYRREK